MLRGLLIALAALVAALLGFVFALSRGWLGDDEVAGDPVAIRRPGAVVGSRQAVQSDTIESLGASRDKQVLFGDFHVHTTFSFDSFLMNLPMAGS